MMVQDLPAEIHRLVEATRFSDLHIHSELPLALRVDGKIQLMPKQVVAQKALDTFIQQYLNAEQTQQLVEKHSLDTDIQCGQTHFRANFYHTRGKTAMVLRRFAENIPSMDAIGLPQCVQNALTLDGGLIVVSGATGAGKSTSLAAIAQHLLNNNAIHLITIEDPIEYFFTAQGSVVSQRQLGRDTHSFDSALYAALREDPDVILLGEMRTPQTIAMALIAAELGHLVLGTLHAGNASDTVARMVHAFGVDAANAEYVRMQLADSLKFVISQQLVARKDTTGRIALFEVLFATPAVKNSIRSNRIFHLSSIIETASEEGMVTFEAFAKRLIQQGMINDVVA